MVAGEFLKKGKLILDLNQNIDTGFYVVANNAIGLPESVTSCPLLVFKVEQESAVQLLFLGRNIYSRLFWRNKFQNWNIFKAI